MIEISATVKAAIRSLGLVCCLATSLCTELLLWLRMLRVVCVWGVLLVAWRGVVLFLFVIAAIFVRGGRTSSLETLIFSVIIIAVLQVLILLPSVRVCWVLLLLSFIALFRILAVLILTICVQPLVFLTCMLMVHHRTGVCFLVSLLIVVANIIWVVIVAVVTLLRTFDRWVGLTIALCIVWSVLVTILKAVLTILLSIIIFILVVLIALRTFLNRFSLSERWSLPTSLAIAVAACCWASVGTRFAVVSIIVLVFALLFHIRWIVSSSELVRNAADTGPPFF